MRVVEKKDKPRFDLYGPVAVTLHRSRYHLVHIPIAIAKLLKISDQDQALMYVSTEARAILIHIKQKPEGKK